MSPDPANRLERSQSIAHAIFIAAVTAGAVFAFALAASLAYLLFIRPDAAATLKNLPHGAWWFIYKDASGLDWTAPLWNLGASFVAALFSLALAMRIGSAGAGAPSPEIVPFLAFLLLFPVEALRSIIALLASFNRSIAAGIVLSRAVHWGRLSSLLCLLLSSLYPLDLKYRRFPVLFGVVFGVAFAVVAYIPLDRTILLAQLAYRLGDEEGMAFVTLALAVLSVAGWVGAAIRRRNLLFALIAALVTGLLTARDLLFYSVRPAFLAVGAVLFAVASVFFLRTVRKAAAQSPVDG